MKKKVIPSLADRTYCVRLSNGLSAYIIPEKRAKVVYMQAYVRTGSIHEDEFLGCGLSHYLEHMLFMGSSRYPGNSASDKVTALGGYFNACTGKDYTSYITFLPSRYLAEGMDILDDMLRNPLFPAEKFESDIQHDPVHHITAQHPRNIAYHTAHRIGRDHCPAENEKQSVVSRRQHPVNGDLEHPRQCKCQCCKDDVGNGSEEYQPVIGLQKRP